MINSKLFLLISLLFPGRTGRCARTLDTRRVMTNLEALAIKGGNDDNTNPPDNVEVEDPL